MKVQNEAIPEDWKLKKIGDLATVTAGGTPSTKNKNYWGGEIPWMNSGEIKKGLSLMYKNFGNIRFGTSNLEII